MGVNFHILFYCISWHTVAAIRKGPRNKFCEESVSSRDAQSITWRGISLVYTDHEFNVNVLNFLNRINHKLLHFYTWNGVLKKQTQSKASCCQDFGIFTASENDCAKPPTVQLVWNSLALASCCEVFICIVVCQFLLQL